MLLLLLLLRLLLLLAARAVRGRSGIGYRRCLGDSVVAGRGILDAGFFADAAVGGGVGWADEVGD